jgi:hypothetical protein
MKKPLFIESPFRHPLLVSMILSHLEQYLARCRFSFFVFALRALTRPWQSIDAVPGELRKNMQAIRSYDVKQQALHAQLQAEQSTFVAEAKRRTDAGEEVDDEALQALKEQYRTVLALCDKKVRSDEPLWGANVFLAGESGQQCVSAAGRGDSEAGHGAAQVRVGAGAKGAQSNGSRATQAQGIAGHRSRRAAPHVRGQQRGLPAL